MSHVRPGIPEPFFLRVDGQERFCLFHPPAGGCRGAVLYVHPFAEELNRSRHMAALQARALAAIGYGVLQIDLHGCGDSSGDFLDARWDSWKRDLHVAATWLDTRLNRPLTLLGLRLGAALALDFAQGPAFSSRPPAAIVLWQPVLTGQAFMTQFLRMRLAADMLAGSDARAGTAALRAALARGEALEVAGYELHPELARAIDVLDATALAPRMAPVHWFDVVSEADRPPVPATASTIRIWRALGVRLQLQQVTGPQFWATPEISACPALVAATCQSLKEPDNAA